MLVNALLLLHLAAAVTWLGGMGFVLGALRPALLAAAEPPQRARLLFEALRRFFPLVTASIVVLLISGGVAFARVGGAAPIGWSVMAGIGALMIALFVRLYTGPWRAARAAARIEDWSAVGAALARVHPTVRINFALGWLAVAAVTWLR